MLVLPEHYDNSGRQPIHVIEAYDLNFNMGNVLKYICRAGKKSPNPREDLEKALTYTAFELNPVKKRAANLPDSYRLAQELGLRERAIGAFREIIKYSQGNEIALKYLHAALTQILEDLTDDAT